MSLTTKCQISEEGCWLGVSQVLYTVWAQALCRPTIRVLGSVLLNQLSELCQEARATEAGGLHYPSAPTHTRAHSPCLLSLITMESGPPSRLFLQRGSLASEGSLQKRDQPPGLRQEVQEEMTSSCFLFGCCTRVNGPHPYKKQKQTVKQCFAFWSILQIATQMQ